MKIGLGERVARFFDQVIYGAPAEQAAPHDAVQRGPVDPAQLRLVTGQGKLFQFPTDGSVFLIGRSPEAALRPSADCVSRKHAYGCWKDGQLWIQDAGSKWGTKVNGMPIKPGQWVATNGVQPIELGGPEGLLSLMEVPATPAPPPPPPPRTPHPAFSPQTWQLTLPGGAAVPLPGEGQQLSVGRNRGNGIQLKDTQTSGQHAFLKTEGGQLLVYDADSLNGTYVNGQRIAPRQWLPVPLSSTLRFGREEVRFEPLAVKNPVEEIKLPDGRDALVETLPDGSLKVSKVDVAIEPSELKGRVMVFKDVGVHTTNWGKVQPGMKVMLQVGRPCVLEFLGERDGKLRFGHTDTYTPARFQQYVQAQRDYLEAEAKERAERQTRRESQAKITRFEQMRDLGISEEMLTQNPVEAAGRILHGNGRLGVDGISLWPREVNSLVLGFKRQELEKQTVTTVDGRQASLKEAGLVDLRMQQWMAEQRGEFLLFRGIKGPYDERSESMFWTNELGSAVGYALNDQGQEQTVMCLRIPRSDIPRFYRNVGGLPGRAQYAEVYEISRADLDEERRPMVLMTGKTHPAVLGAYAANARIQNYDEGVADFRRLDKQLRGEYHI